MCIPTTNRRHHHHQMNGYNWREKIVHKKKGTLPGIRYIVSWRSVKKKKRMKIITLLPKEEEKSRIHFTTSLFIYLFHFFL